MRVKSQKKLFRLEYIQLIADIITNDHGGSLIECNRDIIMAKSIIKALESFLSFRDHNWKAESQFNKWRKEKYKICCGPYL